MKRKVVIFSFYLICLVSPKTHANQKEESSTIPKVENLLILGAGSSMGAEYKLDIFQRLRPLAKKIYLCELEGNTLARKLYDENLVDDLLFVKHCEDYKKKYKSLKKILSKKRIPVDAVVTYRDEWLKIRSILAYEYNLSHQDFKAVSTSQDKLKTRETLQNNGFKNPRCQVGQLNNLGNICRTI